MIEKYKDTDLREALRRKYSDTPPLPADFMAKMQEQIAQQHEPTVAKPATKKSLWRWIAAAACLLVLIGLGVTMLPKDQTEQGKEIYAQTHYPQKTDEKLVQDGQEVQEEQKNKYQETAQNPTTTVETAMPIVAEVQIPAEATTIPVEATPSTATPITYQSTGDANLHYASQSLTEDTTYQAPSRMDEFIAKMAEYHHVKAVTLDSTADKEDNTIVNTAYIFQDTKELNLFARLLQAACSYDSNTPGYLLNFSHQQFFFTLKDLRKGEKYLWIAERIDGGRILLFNSHSPIDANVSSACYQKYREQLTHIPISSSL